MNSGTGVGFGWGKVLVPNSASSSRRVMDKPKTLRRLGEFLSVWGKVILVTEALMFVLIPLGYMGLFFYFLLGMFWNIISPAMLVLRWFLTNMWGDPSNVLAFLIDLPIAVSFIIAGHILKRKYSD